VGPRTNLDKVVKRKNSSLCREPKPSTHETSKIKKHLLTKVRNSEQYFETKVIPKTVSFESI
jgi:hypothetical protein